MKQIQVVKSVVPTVVLSLDDGDLMPGNRLILGVRDYIIQSFPMADGGHWDYTALCVNGRVSAGEVLGKMYSPE